MGGAIPRAPESATTLQQKKNRLKLIKDKLSHLERLLEVPPAVPDGISDIILEMSRFYDDPQNCFCKVVRMKSGKDHPYNWFFPELQRRDWRERAAKRFKPCAKYLSKCASRVGLRMHRTWKSQDSEIKRRY